MVLYEHFLSRQITVGLCESLSPWCRGFQIFSQWIFLVCFQVEGACATEAGKWKMGLFSCHPVPLPPGDCDSDEWRYIMATSMQRAPLFPGGQAPGGPGGHQICWNVTLFGAGVTVSRYVEDWRKWLLGKAHSILKSIAKSTNAHFQEWMIINKMSPRISDEKETSFLNQAMDMK